MRVLRKRLIVGVALLLGSATTIEAQAISAPRMRDSAGIRIVENVAARNAPVAFQINPKPIIDLGGERADPRAELTPGQPFHDAERLSNGSIVVSDRNELKVFDESGRIIRVIGRKGQGPGEFPSQLREVCVARGDTIIAINYSPNERVSVFNGSGEHVQTFTISGWIPRDPCFPDGALLVTTATRPNPESALPPERAAMLDRIATLVRVAKDGRITDTLGTIPGGAFSLRIESAPNAVPRGNFVYVGDGHAPEFRVHSPSGKLVRIVRWADEPIAVTDAILSRLGPAPPNERVPETVPAYAVLKVDPAGRAWVRDHHAAGEHPQWTVFAETGALLGRVMLPKLGDRDVEITGFDRDRVVLAWRDADGFKHLSFHSLTVGGR